jgi:type I restriction enzyme S subunit
MSSVLLEDVEGCVFSGFVLRARPKNNMLHPQYCKYCFSTPEIRSAIVLGCTYTTRALTNGKQLSAISIPVPPLAEQEHIAEALSDVDSMISSLEKLIEKKKAVKQGAMQELLMGKKRLPGFTGEWKKIELENIGSITGSGVDKKILPGEKAITLLNYTNVFRQTSINRTDLNHQVTASDEKIKNCSVLKGDVFLTPTSETPEDIALSAVALEDMPDVVYSYHVIRLRPNSSHNGRFINYALSTPIFRAQAVQYAEGSGIRYVITLKKFKEMQVYVPIEKAEQEAIASILSDMDNEIEALEQKLDKTRQIKQGMMQQLLTGKIRLV